MFLVDLAVKPPFLTIPVIFTVVSISTELGGVYWDAAVVRLLNVPNAGATQE